MEKLVKIMNKKREGAPHGSPWRKWNWIKKNKKLKRSSSAIKFHFPSQPGSYSGICNQLPITLYGRIDESTSGYPNEIWLEFSALQQQRASLISPWFQALSTNILREISFTNHELGDRQYFLSFIINYWSQVFFIAWRIRSGRKTLKFWDKAEAIRHSWMQKSCSYVFTYFLRKSTPKKSCFIGSSTLFPIRSECVRL